jgi:hypothetical protein
LRNKKAAIEFVAFLFTHFFDHLLTTEASSHDSQDESKDEESECQGERFLDEYKQSYSPAS